MNEIQLWSTLSLYWHVIDTVNKIYICKMYGISNQPCSGSSEYARAYEMVFYVAFFQV
jgi:hypothetical protein